MELDGYISQLERHGRLLVAAARAAGLEAVVPTCPAWSVRGLVAHVGYVHRWATAHVAGALAQMYEDPAEEEIHARRPPDDQLLAWFEEGHAGLVSALRAAPRDLQCWTFMAAPSSLVFWARRQAHETAVHRVDAELAAGCRPEPFGTDFAIDGIDELLSGFAPRARLGPGEPRGWAVRVEVDEAPDCWTVFAGPERLSTTRGAGPAGCTLSGPAHDLYMVLWNRAELAGSRVRAQGDTTVVDKWASAVRVRW